MSRISRASKAGAARAKATDKRNMTERKLTVLCGKHIKAKKLAEDVWLVGWLFDNRKSGEDMLSAITNLYNAFDERERADGQYKTEKDK